MRRMPSPGPLAALCTQLGKCLKDLPVRAPHASLINRGHRRAGAKVIARMAGTLGVETASVAAICAQCWAEGQARRQPHAAPVPAMTPAVAVSTAQESVSAEDCCAHAPQSTAGGVR
jgi:hypothetical protein